MTRSTGRLLKLLGIFVIVLPVTAAGQRLKRRIPIGQVPRRSALAMLPF